MDVDSSMRKPSAPFITSSPPRPDAKDDGSDFGSFFFQSNSPSEALLVNKKRRSEELDDDDQENRVVHHSRRSSSGNSRDGGSLPRKTHRSSSPGSSPSGNRKVPRVLERFATTGATSGTLLFGGVSKGSAAKRPPLRRPGINPLAGPEPSTSIIPPKSAFPGLYGPGSRRVPSTMTTLPAPRRAFSAQVPPKLLTGQYPYESPEQDAETEPEDESVDHHVSPVPAPKRHGAFRSVSYAQAPLTAAPGQSMMQKLQDAMTSSGRREHEDASAYPTSGGLPGCRENETTGKILPCFAVKEDGIVRITPETVS